MPRVVGLNSVPAHDILSIVPQTINLGAAAGGGGLADLWLQSFGIGCHLTRADLQLSDALMIPTRSRLLQLA